MAVFEVEERDKGTVTVIIPAYNAEKFIRRALDSILAQTYPVSQIIVVDDGSKDATREIVSRDYTERVTLLEQKNGGPGRARNTALRITTGEYIAFLDADDWWEPGKIAEQVRVLESQPKAVGNYTGLCIMTDEGEHLGDQKPADPAGLGETLRWCNPAIPPSSVMLRRSALEKLEYAFDERQRGTEDWNLWFRLSRVGAFCVCHGPLTDYRSSAGGLSGDADHMFGDFQRMLDDTLLEGTRGLGRAIWRRRITSYQAFKACLTARAAGDKARERSYMVRSVMEWPSPFWIPRRFRYFAVTLLRS